VPTQEMTLVSTVSRSCLLLQVRQSLLSGYLEIGKRVERAGRTMDSRTEGRSSLEAFRAMAISTITGEVTPVLPTIWSMEETRGVEAHAQDSLPLEVALILALEIVVAT